MGKRLQSRFSDINQRIIKRIRKDKIKSNQDLPEPKRKSSTVLEEPKEKISKNEPTTKKDRLYSCEKRKTEFNNENVCIKKLPKSEQIVLKMQDNVHLDLLFSDELKNSFLNFINRDFYFHILDEITLEGLDGITVEAFWKRFLIALEGSPYINQYIRNFIWQNVITCNNRITFFELPVPRKELEIYNPFDYMNTDIGVVMELAYEIPDIYPPKPVTDPSVLGSCSTFNERVDISNEVTNLTIDEAEERYGLKLVIVADQTLRTYALCGDLIDPLIEFLNTEYCVLERVGRSRKLGELTQGRMSIGSGFNMDPKSVFHYKMQLYNYELISKQFFYIKSPLLDHNKTGSLLHLRRFYTNIRSNQSFMADEIINILKTQPDYRIESKALRQMYSESFSFIGKLLKNSDFRKLVKLKIYSYRTLYPNSLYHEYTNKNKFEKLVSCYELVNPYVNVAACWRVDESDEEDDEKEDEVAGQMIYNMDTIRNVYYRILLSGDQGCTAKDIKQATGFDVNTTRIGLRRLNGKGVINLTKFDVGKIRKYRYTATCWKNPDEQSISNTSSTQMQKPKISSVRARILERQRAALEKKKQDNSNKPNSIKTTKITNNFLQLETPPFSSCKYLIRNFEYKIEPKTVFCLLENGEIQLAKNYKIDITFITFNTNQIFNINKILDEINPNVRKFSVKTNFENFYINKYSDKCLQTTMLLLRTLLGEITIKKELFDAESNVKKEMSLPDLTKQPLALASQSDQAKLDYMGENPVVDYYENDGNVTIEIFSSTAPEKFRFAKKYEKCDKITTDRVITRIQIILDLINEHKIIEEMVKLTKMIVEVETEAGYDKKIDRKSLYRIIKRLVDEGYIKVYKVVLYNNTINKTVIFVCHPSVNHMDDRIKTSCQQYKWKYFTSVVKKTVKLHVPAMQKTLEKKIGKSPFSQCDVLNSISEMHKLGKIMVKEINKRHNKRVGIVYGVKPKFTRMRIMHEFLFYLVHNYTGFSNPLPSEDVRQLFMSYRIELSDKDLEEMPKIYSDNISWKMFIPPLPSHTGWPNGWALVCDIILRFPISVLLKIHNCSFEDSELLETLNHPVKRFFLVKDLSEKIRKTVLFKRKYLFDVYDTINRLVFCGLVQFGPQKFKEKDHAFIYLNRRASLKDTRSSGPGYNEVENKEYPLIPFYFNTHIDVEQYWQQLNSISLNTKLNAREPGRVVTLTYINTKTEIVKSVTSRAPSEAILFDNGVIPGDGKGAGGLDSSLWSHLIRNWFWSTTGTRSNSLYTGLFNETLKEVPSRTTLFNELRAKFFPKFILPASRNTQKKISFKNDREKTKRFGVRLNKYTRVIQKPRMKRVKREYCDEIDKKIMKKLGTTRAKWTEQEKEYVLLCKIGDIILNGAKTYKKQVVPFTVVRDVLHRICAISKHKTSRAIQRYWIKLHKGSYVGLVNKVVNLFKLKPIAETFALLLNKIGVPDEKTRIPFKVTEPQISAAYVILMSYIFRNKKRILDALEGNLVNNDHLSEDNLKYTEEMAVETENRDKKFHDPKNEIDIKKDIVKSVIHSSLCSKKISELSSQLFKIYQNYSDALIKEAVKELRESNTICCRKKKSKKVKIWDTPFTLSQFYIFFQYSTFNNVTAEEAFRTLINVMKNREKNFDGTVQGVQHKRYGQLLGLNEFFSFYSEFQLTFYLPQSTIILNPDMDDHDELVNELAVRYQLKLKLLQEGNESEMDFEIEGDNDRSKNQEQEITPLDEDKETSELQHVHTISVPTDTQDAPLDFTVDGGNSETISRLKTWITDCMTAESERRSPSPEFMSKRSELNKSEMHFQENIRTREETSDEFSTGLRRISTSEKNLGQIPTLDEIKEGMLKTSVNDEERTIPHITELSDLLTKNFNELKLDVDTLLRLKSHFITEYAALDRLIIDDLEKLQDHYMVEYIENSMRNVKMWEKIQNDIMVKDFLTLPNFEELIRRNGGKDEDIALASEIIQFAANKELIGATAQELKENFWWREHKYSLTGIIKNLMEAGILLQMGIETLTFVHYKYHFAWVVEREFIVSDAPSTSAEEDFVQGEMKSVRMKIMPWVKVNGMLDKSVLKIWITNVLSYSLDFPKVTFKKISEKYCYIKPVDLFYIIQILEELGCIELFIYESREEDLFTEWAVPQERNATFLDKLEDIVIQPNNASMTCLGSFFCEPLTA